MEFVPLWTDILEGPCWKIMDLPADQYRFWTFCLLAAQKYDFADGHLPDERTLAHWCQMDRDQCVMLRSKLVEIGLIDRVTWPGQDRDMPVTGHVCVTNGPCDGVEFKMHDWDEWRVVKDRGAKGRKRRQREREKGLTEESRNGHGHVTARSQDVTPHLTSCISQHSSNNSGGIPPTPLSPTPEESQILARASERWGASSGDCVVSDLLREYPSAWVKVACDAEWDKHQAALNVSYLRGILRGYQRDGGPPKASIKFGKCGDVPPPTTRIYGIIQGP